MAGIDARTGRLLSGWAHVLQSLEKILLTGFGERVGRRWFGSFVPALLGELAVERSVLRFYTAIWTAVDLWEPRLRIARIRFAGTADEVREGTGRFEIDAVYLPRGHLGDTTPAGRRTIAAEAAAGTITVTGS